MDNAMKDIQAEKIVNWETYTQDRNKWKPVVEQAETHINSPHIILKIFSRVEAG
jgi:hypothetical protein